MSSENKEDIRYQRKKRFCEQYNIIKEKHNLSDAKLAEKLDCSLSTLKDSINPNKHFCNSDLLISFCHRYADELGIDINYLYYGEATSADTPVRSGPKDIPFSHPNDLHILDDPAFMGTFYGYCQDARHDTIDTFTLTIGTNENGAFAKLNINCSSVPVYGNNVSSQNELYGTPIILLPDLVYITFQSESGSHFYSIYYKYIKINDRNKNLYCAYGSLTTIFHGTSKFPQQQAFIISSEPIKEDNIHYIKGFLKMSQDQIIISSDILDEPQNGLMSTDCDVKEIFDRNPQINLIKESVYCLSEKMLLALGEANNIERSVTAKAILTLKEHSMNPKRINYPVTKLYLLNFIKNLVSD